MDIPGAGAALPRFHKLGLPPGAGDLVDQALLRSEKRCCAETWCGLAGLGIFGSCVHGVQWGSLKCGRSRFCGRGTHLFVFITENTH